MSNLRVPQTQVRTPLGDASRCVSAHRCTGRWAIVGAASTAAPSKEGDNALPTRLWGKTAIALAATAALALVPAAGASAALIDTSACDGAQLTQPFSQWGDSNYYKLAPGGDFEGSLSGWTLSGGAKKVAGGYAGSSVSIPAGGSVTTAATCVNAAYPSFRFFTKSSGGLLGLVAAAKVDLVYHDNLLGLVALPAGVLLPSGQWKPTAPMFTLAAVAGLVSDGEAPLSIRITSVAGTWNVDNVFIDPHQRW
jgi:hypothetical protein